MTAATDQQSGLCRVTADELAPPAIAGSRHDEPADERRACKLHDNVSGFIDLPRECAGVDSLNSPSVTRNWPDVVEILKTVIGSRFDLGSAV